MPPSQQQILKLFNGKTIPALGFGTWKAEKNIVGEAIKCAIKVGYRHIDGAAIYENEVEIGHALKEVFEEGKVKREDLFVTSKLWCTCFEPKNVDKHFKITLKDLGLKYLDLYLMHWPMAFEYTGESLETPYDDHKHVKLAKVSMRETWQAMEKLVDQGLVKSIGVANFNVQSLIDVMSYARIQPAVNQVEIHPYLYQQGLKSYCDKNNIHVTAYSPLGHGKLVDDKAVGEIAKKYNRSVASILIRWSIQNQFSVIPKSTNPERIADNFKVLDFNIQDSDMQTLNSLNKNIRTCDPAKFWSIELFD